MKGYTAKVGLRKPEGVIFDEFFQAIGFNATEWQRIVIRKLVVNGWVKR